MKNKDEKINLEDALIDMYLSLKIRKNEEVEKIFFKKTNI